MNIETDKKSKSYCSVSEMINSPVGNVYSKILNISEWPKWRSGVEEVLVEGKITAGSKFIWKAGGLKFKSKIHTAKTNKEIGWTGKTLWLFAVHNWKFEEIENKTIVTIEENLRGFGSGFLKNSITAAMKRDILDLKNAVENKS